MSKLNELTEKTKKIIHLMITDKCDRKCPDCCNNQYDLNSIPFVTAKELKDAEVICLTGGEPFAYDDPVILSIFLKDNFTNIKKIYVYTNVFEFYIWKKSAPILLDEIDILDGINFSIKSPLDAEIFDKYIKNDPDVTKLPDNRLYVFDNLYSLDKIEHFNVIDRKWQKEFVPATDSIFRKLDGIKVMNEL